MYERKELAKKKQQSRNKETEVERPWEEFIGKGEGQLEKRRVNPAERKKEMMKSETLKGSELLTSRALYKEGNDL